MVRHRDSEIVSDNTSMPPQPPSDPAPGWGSGGGGGSGGCAQFFLGPLFLYVMFRMFV